MKRFHNRSNPVFNFFFLLLMAFMLVINSGCNDDSSDSSNKNSDFIPTATPNSGNYSIDSLTIDEKPDDYHPLKYKTSQLVGKEELAFMLPDPDVNDDNSQAFILDDADADYAKISTYLNSDHFYMNRRGAVIHKTAAGDITGDGQDELLMIMSHKSDWNGSYDFQTHLFILRYNPDTGETETLKEYVFNSFHKVVPYGADLAIADVNNDGYDDVIFTVDNWHLNYDGYDIGNADRTKLYVYKKARTDWVSSPYSLASGTYNTRVAVGNIDDDPYDEIVLISSQISDRYPNYKKTVAIWDAVAGPDYFYHTEWKSWEPDLVLSNEEQRTGLAVGDFDNDHIDEFAFGLIRNDIVDILSYQYHADSDNFVTYKHFDISTDSGHTISNISLAVGDFEGDGADELTVSFLDKDDSNMGTSTPTWRFYNHAFTNYKIYPNQNKTTEIVPFGYSAYASAGAQLSTGDVDHDGIDEIIIATTYGEKMKWMLYNLEKEAVGSSWEFKQTNTSSFDISNHLKSGDYFSSGSFMTLGDFDGDSLKVKYTDDHWVHMIDPVITTVLIAPPTEFDIPQAHHHSHVTFGKINETTVEEGTTFESSIAWGFSIKEEFSLLAKLAEAGVKEGVVRESKITDTTAVRTESVTSFTGDCYGNYVIFLGTAYHSYKYEIIASPDPDLLGTYMTIDLPVGSGYWKWEIDYFNENNGDAPDIGAETFSSIPGRVASYPRPSVRDDIMINNEQSGVFSATTIGGSIEQHVNQGISGNTGVGLTISEEESHEEEKAWGWENEIEASVCGIGGWISSSFTKGSLVKFTYSQATEYEGGVGDIITCFNEEGSDSCYKASLVEESEDYEENYPYWDNYYYSWGMFVYNLFRSDENVKYNVINFWVDGLGPAYDNSKE